MGVKEAARFVAETTGLSAPRSLSEGAGDEGCRRDDAATGAPPIATAISPKLAAAALLAAKGYRLIARRYKTPLGEIDLDRQARAAHRLRRGEGAALAARRRWNWSAAAAERRIVGAADLWLAKHPDAAGLDLRYDMVVVAPWRLPLHLPDAFRPSWQRRLVIASAAAAPLPVGRQNRGTP